MSKLVQWKRYADYYDEGPAIDELRITKDSKTRVVAIDDTSLQQIILKGENFKFEGGVPVSGQITYLATTTSDGQITQSFENFKVNAGALGGETMFDFLYKLLQQLDVRKANVMGTMESDSSLYGSSANDRINGRAGDDQIQCGKGNDILTGGQGADTFIFLEGNGKDRITDFDADGGPDHQDFINANGNYPGDEAIHKSGKHDTLIDFGNGDTLLLLGVKPGHIDESDFVLST